MKDDRETIPMPEYGVCDVASRITCIPTRYEDETPEAALDRGRAEAHAAIMDLAGLLGCLVARWEIDGRIKYDADGNVVEAPWLHPPGEDKPTHTAKRRRR
jgi:hypothetical protein